VINPTEKRCTKCGEVKDLSMFSKACGGKYYNSYCKKCVALRTKIWYENNKERAKEYRLNYNKNSTKPKEYIIKNRDKVLEWKRNDYFKHKDLILQKQKQKYDNLTREERDILNKKAVIKYSKKREQYRSYGNKSYHKSSKNLDDRYIVQLLNTNLTECQPELIELKRTQIKLLRLIKELD